MKVNEKGRVAGAAGGALGLTAFATMLATCCGTPWAVALLGVTGAVALARLSFLMPYALIGVAALLGLGFWWAYGPLPACSDGTCDPASRRALRWIVWASALLIAGMIALAALPLLFGSRG
jgi:hypothetical protein